MICIFRERFGGVYFPFYSILAMPTNWRVQCKTGEAQKVGNQPSKSTWLNKVDNDWSRFLYEKALDWKHMNYPDEVAKMLVDDSDQCVEAKGKWINLLKFGEEWNM